MEDAEIICQWRDRIDEDIKRFLDKSEPLLWRLFRPNPQADDVLLRLGENHLSVSISIQKILSELSRLIDADAEDLRIISAAIKLKRRLGNFAEVTTADSQVVAAQQKQTLLSECQKSIVDAIVRCGAMKAEQLSRKACYPNNSNFRSACSS